MRLFVAIDLPEQIRERAAKIKKELAKGVAGVKWVEDHNLHITLKFLGEVEDSRLDEVTSAIGRAVADENKFTLNLGTVGCFPGYRRPRVIWLGLTGETGQIHKIGEALDRFLADLGIPFEKNRKPHLTLGRVRENDHNEQLIRNLNTFKEGTENPGMSGLPWGVGSGRKGDQKDFAPCLPEQASGGMNPFLVKEIVLFRSHLTRQGPEYMIIEKFGLK